MRRYVVPHYIYIFISLTLALLQKVKGNCNRSQLNEGVVCCMYSYALFQYKRIALVAMPFRSMYLLYYHGLIIGLIISIDCLPSQPPIRLIILDESHFMSPANFRSDEACIC